MTQQPLLRWIPEDTFGDRLRRVRRELKLSQADFAEQLGEGVKAVGAWEIGTREPRGAVALAKRIELAFGVPASWLLGLESEITPGPGGPGGGTEGNSPLTRWSPDSPRDLRPGLPGFLVPLSDRDGVAA